MTFIYIHTCINIIIMYKYVYEKHIYNPEMYTINSFQIPGPINTLTGTGQFNPSCTCVGHFFMSARNIFETLYLYGSHVQGMDPHVYRSNMRRVKMQTDQLLYVFVYT